MRGVDRFGSVEEKASAKKPPPPKPSWMATRYGTLASLLMVTDIILGTCLYLAAYDFDLVQLWKRELQDYVFSESLADIYFCMCMRLWIAGLALDYRWPYLGVTAGLVSTAFVVAKVAAFTLWDDTLHNQLFDSFLIIQLFFSIVLPAVMVPKAVESLLQHHDELVELAIKKGDDIEVPKKRLSFMQLGVVLKPYFWPRHRVNRIKSVGTIVLLSISKACNIAGPLFLGITTNAIKDGNVEKACVNVALYCFVKFGSSAFKEFQGMAYLTVKQAAYNEIAEFTFTHLHTLSLDWHLKKKMGNTLRSMNRGVESANNVVNYLFLYLLPTLVECLVVIIIFMTLYKSALLALVVFTSLVLYVHVTIKLTLWRKKFRENTNKSDNEFHDRATDSLINYETVKYFNMEAYEIGRFVSAVKTFQKYTTETMYSLSVLNISQQFLFHGCLLLASVIMIYNSSDVGAFVAVQAYMLQLFQPLNFLGTIYGMIVSGLVDMQNLSELLAETPDLQDKPNAPVLKCGGLDNPPSVEYRDIIFHYPTQDPRAGLKSVSFTCDAGTRTAIVGSTGSGKTTLGRLLFRFYDPHSGGVYINGQCIRDLTQHSVRKTIGVVPQDTVMFNDSILHNLKYGRQDATMEEIEEVCRKAQILDFIKNLPESWETVVGERGLKLSGGEKQRVAIARCLLKNPPIVLLDEATSALDNKTEREVQGSLNSLGQNRTTLIIAHRLSTIRNANRIIVLDKGTLVENGPHDALMAIEDGHYQSLWNAQRNQDDTDSEMPTPHSSAANLRALSGGSALDGSPMESNDAPMPADKPEPEPEPEPVWKAQPSPAK